MDEIRNHNTVVGGMEKIADRITEGQPDGKNQSMEAMAVPCLKRQTMQMQTSAVLKLPSATIY